MDEQEKPKRDYPNPRNAPCPMCGGTHFEWDVLVPVAALFISVKALGLGLAWAKPCMRENVWIAPTCSCLRDKR